MRTQSHHRRAGLFAAVVGIAVVLPLSAAASGSTPATNGTLSQVATTPAIADTDAIWGVLQKLPARDVDVLHASFTPEVRDDLSAMVHAVAAATLAGG